LSAPASNPASRAVGARALVWPVFAVLFLINYLPTLKWMVMRWDEPESYMSHGWLIPVISGFLAWRSRDAFRAAPKTSSTFGLILFLVSLFLHLVAGLADVSSISGLTLAPALFGFVLFQYGSAAAKTLWFPIFFLVFMVPPPEFMISSMNFTLKLMAADLATHLLDYSGLAAIRQGSFLMFGEEKLAIGDVCSGMRSLLALLSLSVLYAWLIRDKGKTQVIAALVTALPAAIVGNGIRIFLVAYLVQGLGSKAVFKPLIGSWDLHLFTGAVIFSAALGCLYLVTALLDRVPALRAKGNHAG
jgi:exosortase